MTVSSETASIEYAGDGVTTAFSIPFAFLSNSDIQVATRDDAGDSTVITTGFTITGAGTGSGTCTFTTAPDSDTDIVIRRKPTILQPVDYVANDAFPAETHETALDRLTYIAQRLAYEMTKGLRVPDGDGSIGDAMVLPAASTRLGKYLYFDETTGEPEVAELATTGTTLSKSVIGGYLYPRTAAEIAAGVTPSDYGIPSTDAVPWVHPARYGGVSDATTNANTAIANAYLVAAQAKCPVYLGGGSGYLVTQNIAVPVGSGSAVDTFGSGWTTGGLLFSGAAVTTGLTFTGSSYSYAGSVEHCRIRAQSSAVRCITFDDVNHPRVVRCHLSGAAGAGVLFDTTLMGVFSHCLVTGCGSATEGSVEVDGTGTTFLWDHSRISGGTVTVGGLIINRTFNVVIRGGAIESCGCPIKIGNKTETSRGCTTGAILDIDLEAPAEAGHYIEMGYGLSGSARVQSWRVHGCTGSPSGTADVNYAVKVKAALGVDFRSNNWALAGTPVSIHELETEALGITIGPHRHLYDATGVPWVRINGTMVKAAGPYVDWNIETVPAGVSDRTSVPNKTGTTPSILISATQGGFYRRIAMVNGGATTVTALTGGENGMEIEVYSTNGNTTLTHSTSTADQFYTRAGSNLVMAAGAVYRFVHNGTLWLQVA